MTDLAWGGHANGDVPASAMVAVKNFAPIESGSNSDPGINSNLMMPEAAHQLGLWQDAYEAHFGKPLNVSEAYRGIIRQRALYELYQSGGTLAAVPGTSNHGLGRAADLGFPVSSFGTAEHDWCATSAAAYGFQFDVATEAWHASYYGNPTITTASVGTLIKIPTFPKGRDMSTSYIVTTSSSTTRKGIVKGMTFAVDHGAGTIRLVRWSKEQGLIEAAQLKPFGQTWEPCVGDTPFEYAYDHGFKRIGW